MTLHSPKIEPEMPATENLHHLSLMLRGLVEAAELLQSCPRSGTATAAVLYAAVPLAQKLCDALED